MLKDWLPVYFQIAHRMGYSIIRDQLATLLLSFLLVRGNFFPKQVQVKIWESTVLIFGAGPSLTQDLQRLQEHSLASQIVIIAADGATSALLEFDILPDVIVTDLDGSITDILKATRLGSFPIVHAHGDNIPQLLQYVPRFKRASGTTQVLPLPNIRNYGGFTDGDRCVFLAEAMGAERIILAGMDFGKEIGKYSKQEFDPCEKRKKLRIGKNLLEWFASNSRATLYNFTKEGEPIKGFREITLRELHTLT